MRMNGRPLATPPNLSKVGGQLEVGSVRRPTIEPKDPVFPTVDEILGGIRSKERDALWMKHVIGIDTTSPI